MSSRECDTKALGDLGYGHSQPSQRLERLERLHPLNAQLPRPAVRRRTAIEKAGLALGAPAGKPLAGRSLADASSLCRH